MVGDFWDWLNENSDDDIGAAVALQTQRNIASIYQRPQRPVIFDPSRSLVAATQGGGERGAMQAVSAFSSSAQQAASPLRTQPLDPRVFSVQPRTLGAGQSRQGLLDSSGGLFGSPLLWLGLAAAGGLWYYRSRRKRRVGIAGPES